MPEIKINNQVIQALAGDTVLNAAKLAGISIPTMCWMKEFRPSTSCMVCVVQDDRNGKILTSCSAVVEEGMDIKTDNETVLDLRKSALELLLSEHYGDCEAPCQRVCPAEMDIPQMNRLIAANKFDEALKLVKETIALPAVLGYICPAPCEKACRRKEIDEPVSICLLKRFVAEEDLKLDESFLPQVKQLNKQRIAIIGAGPSGLAAAFYLAKQGFTCHVYDKNSLPGGKIRTDIAEELLPKEVLDKEIEGIKALQVEFFQNKTIGSDDIATKLSNDYQFVVWTVGSETAFDSANFELVNGSQLKDLHIFKLNDCHIFVPKQISSKSKMAVRAVGLGRKLSEWITEFADNNEVLLPEKQFNSVYKNISSDEQLEFLKDATNPYSREKTHELLQGFTIEQAIAEAKRCLHCDCRKQDSCVLRNLSTDYKASQRVYSLASHKKVTKDTEHEKVVFERLKCIKCGICIQTAHQEGDKTGFAYSGRGFDVQVAIPIGKSICELSTETILKCAKNCPTGAISLK